MRRIHFLALAATLAVTATSLPALAGAGGQPGPPAATVPATCTGDPSDVSRIELTVSGETAWGLYALPPRRPRALVVFMHGYTHTAYSWAEHMRRVAGELDVVAVAMNYRGQKDFPPQDGGLPTSRGWRVAEGAEDSIAAAQFFTGRCRDLGTVVAYGVSMGFNTAGLAVAAGAARPGGGRLFDWLVDVEGAANVTETYHEARLVAQTGNAYAANATADIEEEMGGTFEQRSDVYLERTVVNRVDDIAASGVRGVFVVHGVLDGTVPYNQSRELVAALRAAGVPVDLHTVVTRDERSEPGTTIDSYIPVPGHRSPFAGHASETSTTHLVGRTGFERLAALLRGVRPRCREYVVDGNVSPVVDRPLATGPAC